jgi:hypothetical protein
MFTVPSSASTVSTGSSASGDALSASISRAMLPPSACRRSPGTPRSPPPPHPTARRSPPTAASSTRPPRAGPGQGENLWMGTAGSFSLEEMVGSWSVEKRLFTPGTVPNVSRSGHFSDVGHYTQMIWRRTTRVGCALHRSRANDYLICRYSPPGNVLGERVP